MAELRFEQVQRFILVKKIFWGDGHFNRCTIQCAFHIIAAFFCFLPQKFPHNFFPPSDSMNLSFAVDKEFASIILVVAMASD